MKNWIGQSTIPIFKGWTGPDVMPLESGGNLSTQLVKYTCTWIRMLKSLKFKFKKKNWFKFMEELCLNSTLDHLEYVKWAC